MIDVDKHVDAVLYAIRKLGMNEFKKCSFFVSNREGWGGGNLTDESQPRRMTGFFATLTEEQREAALNYRGDDTHPR